MFTLFVQRFSFSSCPKVYDTFYMHVYTQRFKNFFGKIYEYTYERTLDIIFPSTTLYSNNTSSLWEQFLSHTHGKEITFTETSQSLHLISKNIRPALSEITSLFPYHDKIVHEAIWELKYHGNKKISRFFATFLYDTLVEKLSTAYLFSGIYRPLLLPIPSTKARERERGFNQTELIAHELEKLDHNNFFTVRNDIIIKRKDTLPQATLKRAARLHNVSTCFSVSEETQSLIKNSTIILLDDVATTGSTLEAAAQVLKYYGARSVSALTIAH